ncbi:exodeoxyribonuclease VII small subunit [Parahaliea maris]|uniref:Exodeoxyribonuclease 7 small subunit n=1 Tax=Parahaliea maris TaxID=2716870 RepID=A0A5C9A6V9_9GAMM|nr:exodeoxyribonuclease VII small subunit [Parahaliea maris]TXS96695.1 exodeoxyribonuclease VII small subunit [Parahaliea maris]
MATKKTTQTFAENLASIEQIVATLEDTGTSLEASMEEFQRGIQLVRVTQTELSAMEQKICELLIDENSTVS